METATSEQLKLMDERLTEMEDKINSIDIKMTQMLDALLGNPLTKAGGIIVDLEETKRRLTQLENKQKDNEIFRNRVIWTISLIGVVFLILKFALDVYSKVKP
jgi:uncharacterized membrane protein YqjE